MIVVGKDKVGNENKCLKLEYVEPIPSVFIDYLKLKLVAFIELTIFLLDGRIYNSKVFWLPSQKMMFQSLIL
jgi:CRISPR/Cas system CMR-associated protein Cmr3 (group 5 of RAMP superfamily)